MGIVINLCLLWKEVISFHEGCSRDGTDSFCVLRLIDDKKNVAWKNGNKAREGLGQENVGTEHSLYPQTSLKAKNMIPSLRRGGKWPANASYCKDATPFRAISLPEELITGRLMFQTFLLHFRVIPSSLMACDGWRVNHYSHLPQQVLQCNVLLTRQTCAHKSRV